MSTTKQEIAKFNAEQEAIIVASGSRERWLAMCKKEGIFKDFGFNEVGWFVHKSELRHGCPALPLREMALANQ